MMPKSLDTGVSERLEIKIPASEKAAAIASLADGETISELVRYLLQRETKKRAKRKNEV